jgi:hypothetical protein
VAGHRGVVRVRTIVALAVALAALTLAGWDASRPPARQLGTRTARALLELHRSTSAVWLARSGVRCRFRPSCSVYADRVLADRGWLAAAPVIARRIVRCGPWTSAGTSDPWPPSPVAPATPSPVPSHTPSMAAKE